MSRSGYSDDGDFDGWSLICWRGAVASALRGKRGQLFLYEMLNALDALPVKRLIAEDLATKDGDVCALGAVGKRRGVDMTKLDPHDYDSVAGTFGLANAMAQEIMYENDEGGRYKETPEQRYARVHKWVRSQITEFGQ